jgi:uncharacterized protein (DUF2141 family)
VKNVVLVPYAAVFFVFIVSGALFSEKNTGTLKIVITGFETDKGKALVALCNSETNFNSGNSYRRTKSVIKNGRVELSFDSIPYGEYAVKVLHDENNNEKLDLQMFGIPKEAYGFSNNKKNKFGPTKYDAARFRFGSDVLEITIDMR